MAADRAGYLAAYEAWVREGRPGLAPSAQAFGLMSCDLIKEVCEIDEMVRRESGLSSWQYHVKEHYHAPRPKQR